MISTNMQNKLIVANWKMNGDINKIKNDFAEYRKNIITNSKNVVFAVPQIYLACLCDQPHEFKLACQDLSKFGGPGAYTGEVSSRMLKELAVDYSIIGHSERRSYLLETDDILLAKLQASLSENIKPIFCIGESKTVRNSGQYINFLIEQLMVLKQLNNLQEIIIAYEPIWSIGTGLVPQLEQIDEVAQAIDAFLCENFIGAKVTIIYGGSVSATNVKEILSLNSIGGVLVGGASLKPADFIGICSYNMV